ncbi:phosphoribosylaminoimidazole-succinocarboxamide synthase [Paenibacillus cellulosilyticus]|uniref:Phosphoribosylaminoimidazole-succinocarboxamide synthase n=1 Tax=Paenibacillus cellulosilyticus TaxID=375489 RepID=A0A2V2YTG0_9BACL|nr:phosphoribosylaminoimidazolesuccinocarboxamide synthase [Paenibacillus cellulosilyticus]PWW02744.1 phosphoribosylaminoimidazole-succinocarboxamide synthase [Paenibacillus cellulosilyticus]QKS45669.1 phosphoribosylaminoimidazolesuccinocarboxamide synthase [Paenibacillus cellulosilyticus]
MITKETIQKNLMNCLDDTSFLNVPGFRRDKVRDTYDLGDSLILITTDRQSAFDRILANIPFKGQVLNQLSAFWFENTSDIISNHVIKIPDPNVTIGKKCKVFPVEFVMRAYLTGSTDTSAWVQYSQGIRDLSGHILPDGMKRNQKFEQPILTPAMKSSVHDESISAAQIVNDGIIDKDTWEYLQKIAFSLFARGTEIAARNGLILVDTKYEFGIDDKGEILLIDEIHTPDSSRYWMKDTYESRLAEGKEPENIDKEFLRLWFREHCDPYKDKILPAAPDDLVIELSHRYIRLFEMITGKQFSVDGTHAVKDRLKKNLNAYLI